MKHKLLFLASLLFICQVALSQNYQLDSTFGVDGKVVNVNVGGSQVTQLQSNGKIVCCFLSSFSTSGNVHLTRFNSNGSLDTSFGINGFVDLILFSEIGGFKMMKIQNDDKIIVTGNLENNGIQDFATARFNADGTIDTNFGTNGIAVTDFGTLSSGLSTAIEIQNNGSILVGGYISQNSLDIAIVRYFTNGTIDTNFGTNGKFIYNFGTTTIPFTSGMSSDEIIDIKVNSVGKIIICALTDANESSSIDGNFGFICLNSNGSLDTTFGSNGQKIVDLGGQDYITNIKLTTNDKIIATGQYGYSTGNDYYTKIAIIKLLENGEFDINFGNNGIVLANKDASSLIDFSRDLYLQTDGKIVCFGGTLDISKTVLDFLIIRFNVDGTIDNTFNSIGYKTIGFNNYSVIPTSILVQNDGKILCSGGVDNNNFVSLARLEIDNLSTDNFLKESISVYPNPVINSLNLDFNLSQNEVLNINLFDVNGRKITNLLNEKNFQGNNSLKLELPETLSKGIYFLNISNGKYSSNIKIVK